MARRLQKIFAVYNNIIQYYNNIFKVQRITKLFGAVKFRRVLKDVFEDQEVH